MLVELVMPIVRMLAPVLLAVTANIAKKSSLVTMATRMLVVAVMPIVRIAVAGLRVVMEKPALN